MSTENQSLLFSPLEVGPITLAHRVVMAPLTRMRSDQPGDIPGELMAEYYGQRSTEGGLIITESVEITPEASAYEGVPGVYTDAQVAGWRKITDTVHARGGRIFIQIWHPGRVSHIDIAGGATPAGPSAIPFKEVYVVTSQGVIPASPTRALETREIPTIIEQYRRAAVRAKDAGFDGVEILAGGGYLLDQFLQNGTNHRTDQYGGSIENRARLLLEVTATICSVWPAERVAVRLSPSGTLNSVSDSDPQPLFDYVVGALNQFGLAYLHLIEPRVRGGMTLEEDAAPIAAARLRKIFQGKILAAGGFDPEGAQKIMERGDADMVAFGRHFIANPDLPKRIELGLSLTPYDRSTFYGGDHRGYTDYPFSQERVAVSAAGGRD